MPDTFLAIGSGLHFARFGAQTVEAEVDAALSAHRSVIERIVRNPAPTFANAIVVKEQADALLGTVLGAASQIAAVCDTPDYRAAYQNLQPRISGYFADLGQNRDLLATFTSVRDAGEALSPEERRAIDLAIRDFHLSGIALPDGPRGRFAEIAVRLDTLENDFANAVLDATESWARPLHEDELAGIPERARAILEENARAVDEEGWMATLDQPSVQAIMTFAENRALRREVYHAEATRASELGPDGGLYDNGPRMAEILALRREAANLLGFEDSVASSLATKMARDSAEVRAFLDGIVEKVRPIAARELAELQRFASTSLGIDPLEPWDLAFASERMRQAVYAIDEDEITQYLPLETVLSGLFAHIHALFDVELSEQPGVETWHPDVRHLVLSMNGAVVASLYLDLHARAGKQDGAWMSDGRHRVRGVAMAPVAYLTCNFAPRTAGRPVLLRHDDVITLFHEMGHCLHHLLTEIDLPSIGGISGVEWDAVELPSQFHEAFAWDADVLQRLSAHAETGAPMPRPLIDRLLAARNFQAGLNMLNMAEKSLFDLEIHALSTPTIEQIDRVGQELRRRCAVMPVPDWHRFSRSFSHIFAGGYEAGYYSYLWAEHLSADAFEAFLGEEADRVLLGQSFRREILARGASRPMIENYVAFRGQAPDNDALLRQRGLAA